MIDLKCCPSTLAEGFGTYSPKASKALFDGRKVSPFLGFSIDGLKKSDEAAKAAGRISVSGVQEKFPAVIEKGVIRLAWDGERSTHILKPAPWDETLSTRRYIPANENLTMQIASQVYGISTAANGLCFSLDGQAVYITRRFDILPDGTKLPMEDFASVIGRSEEKMGISFKYSGSYEEIGIGIRKNIQAWMVDMERFFNMVVFNYIYGNGDAHLKNFSLVRIGQDYRLAPAYDLINTYLHVQGDDFALEGGLSPIIPKSDIYENTGHPCRNDFELFGLHIGLSKKRLLQVLDRYNSIPDAAKVLIGRSFLTEKLKRSYLRTVKERTARLNRYSDNMV